MKDYIFLETGEIIENVGSIEDALKRFKEIYTWGPECERISEHTVVTYDEYKKSLGE
jgi:hypothetical protein